MQKIKKILRATQVVWDAPASGICLLTNQLTNGSDSMGPALTKSQVQKHSYHNEQGKFSEISSKK